MHSLVRRVDLEAVSVILQAGIGDADEPHSFVASANVRETNAELFQVAFQRFKGKSVFGHVFLLI